MPRPLPDTNELTLLLQARGATPSRAITEALGISPATLSRIVARLGPTIEKVGAARSTRYALRRQVRHHGFEWPVYRVSQSGRPQVWGVLRALHGGFRWLPADTNPAWMLQEYADGIFSGLPFFLQDVCPQGYLGRAIAREVAPRLGVPPDIRLWNEDDVLSYFLTEGFDLPGDLVIGDHALERAVRASTSPDVVDESDREHAFPQLAAATQRGEITGSSAGGEQPKFLATVREAKGSVRSVLVKFSAAEPSPVSRRWADLLASEHLAVETLRDRGIAVANSRIIDAGGRRFLEVDRFDRVGVTGRRSTLSLGAIEDAFLDRPTSDWAIAAGQLERGGWMNPKEARILRLLSCFGDLIGNSDMHRANVSFLTNGDPPWPLAPVYDMLPMLFAPGPQGDLSVRLFAPRPPLAVVEDVWKEAAEAALDFWGRVQADRRVSADFQTIAKANRTTVSGMVKRFG